MASGDITTVVTPVVAKRKTGMEAGMSSDDSVGLRYGDGMADATEGVVAAVAAAGGDDEVLFAAGDWVVEDDFCGDGVVFEVLWQGVNTNWRQYGI